MNECPICKSHWDMTVNSGDKHHEFCPAEGFTGTVRESVNRPSSEIEIRRMVAEFREIWERA